MTERKIALYDIDKTSYEEFLLLDIVRYQRRHDILPEEVSSSIERDVTLYNTRDSNNNRLLSYEQMAQNVLQYWTRGLKGKTEKQVVDNAKEFFQTEGRKFFPFVQESIDLLKPTHDTYFVTAEPQFLAEEVVNMHQATGYFSTIFEVKDGVFTGNLSSSLATREDKGNVLKQLLLTHPKEQSFAFGDSDNDINMLAGVEYPICVNPNDELTKIATERDWAIKKPEEVVLYIKDVLDKPKS